MRLSNHVRQPHHTGWVFVVRLACYDGADGGSALPHPCCDGGQSAWANSTATRPAIGRHGFPWLEHAALRPLAGFVATVLCYTPLRYRLWRYRGADTQTCAPRTHLIIKLRLVIKRLNSVERASYCYARAARIFQYRTHDWLD